MRGSISRIIPVEGDANDAKFRLEESKERGVARPMEFFERHLETHGLLAGASGF